MSEENKEEASEEGSKVNALAILSYISILFLVPLLTAKEDEFAQYHAKQGMVLFIVTMANMFLAVIPVLGWLIAPIIFLGIVILAIWGIVNVINGEKKDLPLIGQYAHRFKI